MRRCSLGALLLLSACATEPVEPTREVTWSSLSYELPPASLTTRFDAGAMRGKVVLVTFVTSWCFPCLTDLVTLDKLQRDFGARGFQNVLVGMDLEGRKTLEPFAQSYSFQYPVLVGDARLINGESQLGRLRELPARLLFGRDGALVTAYSGVARYEDLEKLVIATLGPEPKR